MSYVHLQEISHYSIIQYLHSFRYRYIYRFRSFQGIHKHPQGKAGVQRCYAFIIVIISSLSLYVWVPGRRSPFPPSFLD